MIGYQITVCVLFTLFAFFVVYFTPQRSRAIVIATGVVYILFCVAVLLVLFVLGTFVDYFVLGKQP